jgi:sulfur-oxidizing protein SoxZ
MAYETGEARIRVPSEIRKGDLITVHSIVSHPMDTGFFKHVVITYGDQEVARFEWTSGVSRDPVVTFTLRADREAPLTMVWTDNRGGVYRQSTDIGFATA